jgi:hypothetical protein
VSDEVKVSVVARNGKRGTLLFREIAKNRAVRIPLLA